MLKFGLFKMYFGVKNKVIRALSCFEKSDEAKIYSERTAIPSNELIRRNPKAF